MQSTTYEIQDISKANIWTLYINLYTLFCTFFCMLALSGQKVGGAYVTSLSMTLCNVD